MDSSIVQGPIYVAPCQTLISRFRDFFISVQEPERAPQVVAVHATGAADASRMVQLEHARFVWAETPGMAGHSRLALLDLATGAKLRVKRKQQICIFLWKL